MFFAHLLISKAKPIANVCQVWLCYLQWIFLESTAVEENGFSSMVVIFVRNFKSSLYPKKCCCQVTTMILALIRIVLCIKIVFKRVKLHFTWQIKLSADFAEIKMTTMFSRSWTDYIRNSNWQHDLLIRHRQLCIWSIGNENFLIIKCHIVI